MTDRRAVVTVSIGDGPEDNATLYTRSWEIPPDMADMFAAKLAEIYGAAFDEGLATVGDAVALAEEAPLGFHTALGDDDD